MTQEKWLLTREKYIKTLASGNLLRAENTRIISEIHVLNNFRTNKIALSAYDDNDTSSAKISPHCHTVTIEP